MKPRYGNVIRNISAVMPRRTRIVAKTRRKDDRRTAAPRRRRAGSSAVITTMKLPPMTATNSRICCIGLAIAITRQHRNECLRERAFGEQPPEEIRNAERDEERIGDRRCAEEVRQHHVAHQSRDARQKSSCSRRRCPGGRGSAFPRRRTFVYRRRGRRAVASPAVAVVWLTRADPDGILPRFIFSRTLEEISLANSASARKRARQSEKRRRQNASQRSMVRTSIKRTQAAIASGKQGGRTSRADGGDSGHRRHGHERNHPPPQSGAPQSPG